jgi:hypothetical protein
MSQIVDFTGMVDSWREACDNERRYGTAIRARVYRTHADFAAVALRDLNASEAQINDVVEDFLGRFTTGELIEMSRGGVSANLIAELRVELMGLIEREKFPPIPDTQEPPRTPPPALARKIAPNAPERPTKRHCFAKREITPPLSEESEEEEEEEDEEEEEISDTEISEDF